MLFSTWVEGDGVEWIVEEEEEGGSGGSQTDAGGNNPHGRGGLEKCMYCRQRKKKCSGSDSLGRCNLCVEKDWPCGPRLGPKDDFAPRKSAPRRPSNPADLRLLAVIDRFREDHTDEEIEEFMNIGRSIKSCPDPTTLLYQKGLTTIRPGSQH